MLHTIINPIPIQSGTSSIGTHWLWQRPQPMRDEAVPEGSRTAAAATHPPSAKILFTKIVLLQEQSKTWSSEGTGADEACSLCARQG
jgi:hypothetical protein